MSVAFDLWGQRGWAAMDVVGESSYAKAIKALFGGRLRADGGETTTTVQLLPEPLNKHDRNAVAVWAETGQIGYLPRDEAKRYAPVLMELVARGWTPQVAARVWAADRSSEYGPGASVRVDLAEPHMLVPANREPGEPHSVLPARGRHPGDGGGEPPGCPGPVASARERMLGVRDSARDDRAAGPGFSHCGRGADRRAADRSTDSANEW